MKEQEKSGEQKQKTHHHIPFSQLAAYGAGGIIPVALFNIAGQLVGLMGNISLGLSAFWLGVILIIPRLWDAVSDPVIGHLSDNTRTRWGRRRPYLLIGGIAVAICFVILWWIPKGPTVRTWFPTDAGFQWFQLAYILFSLLLFFTATTVFEIPHGALGMEMTTDYHERTRLFSAKSFVGNIFAMSTPWLFALANTEAFKGTGGNEADGMRYVSLLIAAFLIPLSFWWFIKLREPGFVKAVKQEKTPFWKDMKNAVSNRNFMMLVATIFTLAMGFNFVNLLGSYIPIFYVFGGDKVAGARLLGINGTIWAITGVLAVFPLNWISPKLGKRNTLILSMAFMCLAQLSKIVCYNPQYPYLIIIPTVLLSTGMLFFFTLGSSMVGDICDEDELSSGHRTEGSFYAVYWWFIKMGTALASFVAGVLIVLTLFDEIQVTKIDYLQGSIREIRSITSHWKDYRGMEDAPAAWLGDIKKQSAESLKESGEYISYLEKETAIKPGQSDKTDRIIMQERKTMLLEVLADLKSLTTELEQIQSALNKRGLQAQDTLTNSLIRKAIRLALAVKIEKAGLNASELLLHLKAKSLKAKRSRDHYDMLIQKISDVNHRIRNLRETLPMDVMDQEISAIQQLLVPVTKQSPYTLLMMRVVEIGLPLLLSIIAFFFILRYSLTEKRCLEIKELLRQKNNPENT